MKTLIFLTLLLFLASCASTPKPNSRLAQQKKELEAIGFKVDYLK